MRIAKTDVAFMFKEEIFDYISITLTLTLPRFEYFKLKKWNHSNGPKYV